MGKEEKLKIHGTFGDVLKVAMRPPKKKKNSRKAVPKKPTKQQSP